MTSDASQKTAPWYLLPFTALWKLLGLILEFTGRVLGEILGLALISLGIVVSLTVIGAIVGIPLIGMGVLLILRGLF
jgi:hypothetical protein